MEYGTELMNKQAAYQAIVEARKLCVLCDGLTNPSSYEADCLDSDHIGPWSRWQGNLDAKLLIVGQDWSNIDYFEKNHGFDAENNGSNNTLRKLLTSIGIDIDPPSLTNPGQHKVFLTNAILCLKAGDMGAPVRESWLKQCGSHFLKPTIEIVHPLAVISLGKHACESIFREYHLPKMIFREAVDQPEGFLLSHSMRFFPMYHCSRQVLNTHRKCGQQLADWQRVINVLPHAFRD